MRALEKDPAARYPSSSALALALANCSLAGKWTFGDAAHVAKTSSRPPAAESATKVCAPRAPRLPSLYDNEAPTSKKPRPL
jgi:hypothetical protein